MALWKAFKGSSENLNSVELHEGYVYFCTDDGSLFFDYKDADGVLKRKQIGSEDCKTITGVSLEELRNEISNQDMVVLHEAQSYTDEALKNISFDGQGFPIANSDGENSLVQNSEKENTAYGQNSIALGYNTLSGAKGYYISYVYINPEKTGGKIYLSATQQVPIISSNDMGTIDTNLTVEYPIDEVTDKGFTIALNESFDAYATSQAYITSIVNNVVSFEGHFINGDGQIIDGSYVPASLELEFIDDFSFMIPEYANIGVATVREIATALGRSSEAIGQYSTAMGNENKAYGKSSHAQGSRNKALAYCSTAEGQYNTASGMASHAEGAFNEASGNNAHAEGIGTTAKGYSSHAEGNSTKADNKYSHAEGYETTASGESTHAEGWSTSAEGIGSHAEGYFSHAKGSWSHTEGNNTHAVGHSAHAEGSETEANADYTHAEGKQTSAEGIASHAEGLFSTAFGNYSHAEGLSTTGGNQTEVPTGILELNGSGVYAHSEGHYTIARGDASHSEGIQTIATSMAAHVEGARNAARGEASHVEGADNVATGNNSHAEGQFNTVSGNDAHVEGSNNESTGWGSHAEGYLTHATADQAHAEGNGTTASGAGSHAEGWSTIASGDYSHTEGKYTKSVGEASHAAGIGTIATADGQTAVGKYNKENPEALFVVGNGSTDTDRKNALEVTASGDVRVAKNVRYSGHLIKDGEVIGIWGKKPNLPYVDGWTYEGVRIPITVRVQNNSLNYDGTGNNPYYEYLEREIYLPPESFTVESAYHETFTIKDYPGGMESELTYTINISWLGAAAWEITNDSNGAITFLQTDTRLLGTGKILTESSESFSVIGHYWDSTAKVFGPALKVGETIISEAKLKKLLDLLDEVNIIPEA